VHVISPAANTPGIDVSIILFVTSIRRKKSRIARVTCRCWLIVKAG
jgi:hypothetical protein